MIKFHAYRWNNWEIDYPMAILTEEDIENCIELVGAGINILVLPNKYKDVSNEYLDNIRMKTLIRKGEIIYV